jgi:hypothetical protein
VSVRYDPGFNGFWETHYLAIKGVLQLRDYSIHDCDVQVIKMNREAGRVCSSGAYREAKVRCFRLASQ